MKKSLIFLLIFSLCTGFIFGQEVSDRQEISIFAISHTKVPISDSSLTSIDFDIQQVFIQLGRFEVLGSEYRLESENVNSFIQALQDQKSSTVEISEEVAFGHEIFTEADLNALTNTFMVVVPSVIDFNVEEIKGEEKGDPVTYSTEITTNFTFIDVANGTTFDMFQLETSGSADNERDSINSAISSIPGQLENKIRFMPVFQIKTGIIEIDGGDVYLELGQNMGIQVGEDYAIQTATVNAIGRETVQEEGLLVIKDVQSDFSIARILYGNPSLGDQVVEVPRSGVDFDLYTFGGLPLNTKGVYFGIGSKFSPSRGFLDLRPIGGFEVIFVNKAPIFVYAGAEYNMTFRRLQLSPYATLGYGGVVDLSDTENPDFNSSHININTGLNLNYLVSRNTKFYLQAEGSYYMDISNTYISSANFYGTHFDVRVSAGLRFKL